MSNHDVLLWENPVGGRTMSGKPLPPGWVWTCSCNQGSGVSSGWGFATEDDANEAADWHLLPYQQGAGDE